MILYFCSPNNSLILLKRYIFYINRNDISSQTNCCNYYLLLHQRFNYTRRVSKGGHLGHVPPLEPNAQRKNLRRLKDLRGRFSKNLQNFQNDFFFFFCLRHSLKFTLQFGIRKNVICERKVCLSAAPPMRLLFLLQTDFSVT